MRRTITFMELAIGATLLAALGAYMVHGLAEMSGLI